jgi:N-alpha-acetyl-L-2,4-diaminobutyrate deacetylase
MPDDDCFAFSQDAGLIQFCADMGDTLTKGEVIALIHPTGRNGIFTARNFPGLVKSGDCVAVIAVPLADDDGQTPP